MVLDALEQALRGAPTRVGTEQVQYDLEACSCPCPCGDSSAKNLVAGLPLHLTVVALAGGGYKPMVTPAINTYSGDFTKQSN